MGLTNQSTGRGAAKELLQVKKLSDELIIALAGNPNTGKSTVFNNLTGMNQHTGNWPGKTISNAQGSYTYQGENYILVDLPGTYSLLANSVEEEVARDFICFARPDVTVVVTDATCLERNLNMVLQVLEITNNVVVCVNLLDEAKRKNITVNLEELSKRLGVPVIGTSARDGVGLPELKEAVRQISIAQNPLFPLTVRYDEIIENAVKRIELVIREKMGARINSRWVSLRLIENDETILQSLEKFLGYDLRSDQAIMKLLGEISLYLKEEGEEEEIRDRLVTKIFQLAEEIHRDVVWYKNVQHNKFDRKLDNILTSRLFGIPIMIALLGIVFWITIKGANYPSALLSEGLFWGQDQLTALFQWAGAPDWLHGIVVLGIYRTLAWVISVMLPPMAIFFPLFTLLEDLGYLPRIAFNMDGFFKRACTHGKQALTMCMGFGCNAAGVTSCRIIDSPRERLIATLTNNFVPCNGRFPTLIALATILTIGMTGGENSILAAALIMGLIIFSVFLTLTVSKLLSKTYLKGTPSSFTLELPPYRKPRIGQILIRSIIDRTLFVLGRAVAIAAPAGAVIWLMANLYVGGESILSWGAHFLDPFAALIGLDGFILLAFILGFPANEIVIPILIMCYMATGQMAELDSIAALRELFVANGWTWLTVACTMLFALNHWPCGTTLVTIYKETKSKKHTFLAFILPTVTGVILCFLLAQAVRFLGLV